MKDPFLIIDTTLDLARVRFWTNVLKAGFAPETAKMFGDRAAADLLIDQDRLRRAKEGA